MSKEHLFLWLVTELWWLYLTPAVSEDKVVGFLGQSVTLPCQHSSWSQSRNSMCWGRGACPNSKCSQELVHTDGTKVISSKSAKYILRGNIRQGDVSLTISNTNQGDSGVYCCRIEVPGWFNDVKKTVRLELRRVPTTIRPTTTMRPTTITRPTATSHPTTASYLTTTTEELSTTVMTTPVPTTVRQPHVLSTTVLTTAVTTCSSTMPSSFSQETTSLSTIEIFTEQSAITTVPSLESYINFTADDAENALVTGTPLWRESESSQSNRQTNILIIACCVGFVLMVSIFLAFLLRERVTEANCLQRNKRPDNIEDCKSVLNDMPHGREDEEGIFTL